jgi:hypothetical protein
MITTVDMSADRSARKSFAVGNHWVAMYAGNDISCATPIRRQVRAIITADNESLEDVAEAFVSAFRDQLKLKTDSEILAPLGYTLDQFKAEGLEHLGAETFSRLIYEIQQQAIDMTFLVAGFDKRSTGVHDF